MKPTKFILILILVITFKVKADRNVYPGTILLHLDSIGNMQFKKNCTKEIFTSLVYDYNYTIIRSLIPLEDARAYLKFLREIVIIRPEFEEHTYLIDLAQASLLYMSRDLQGFQKFNLSVKEKLLKKDKIGSLFEFEIGLGNFLSFYGNQDSAMEKYREVERIIKQIGFNNLESKAKDIAIVNANALAIGFREIKESDSAEFYFKLGLQRAKSDQIDPPLFFVSDPMLFH